MTNNFTSYKDRLTSVIFFDNDKHDICPSGTIRHTIDNLDKQL